MLFIPSHIHAWTEKDYTVGPNKETQWDVEPKFRMYLYVLYYEFF